MGVARRQSAAAATATAASPHPNSNSNSPLQQQQQEHALAQSSAITEATYHPPTSSHLCDHMRWYDRRIWVGCLIFRVVNALIVRTYFNPDEHWQSLEVAHRLVFGYGHLTWEWSKGLRSYLHPLIFAVLYKILAVLGLDSSWFMIKAPRLLQAVFAAIGDLYLFKLSRSVFGERVARWTLFCQLVNWFTFFCMVRTFSNCLETVLTIVALYRWPIFKQSNLKPPGDNLGSRKSALFIAGLACAIRPTSAIIWLYVGVTHLIGTLNKVKLILFELVPIGAVVLGGVCLLDHWMYGKWVFVPLNFLQYNFLSAGGDFYGSHPWHWYFTQGFPTMMFSMLPLMMAGVYWSKKWFIAGLMLWVLGIYSILGHKEFRFILPILPLGVMFSGYALATLECWRGKDTEETDDAAKMMVNSRSKSISYKRRKWSVLFHLVILGLLLTNIPVALYTSLIHQRGAEAVMEYLHKEASEGRVHSIMFLMPCHSTPYYSTLHKNVPMRFLDCSPSNQEGYIDEADRFMSNPVEFLSNLFGESTGPLSTSHPSHIVLFDSLKPRLSEYLDAHFYKEVQKLFQSHFPVDRELQANVLVYARTRRN